MHAVPATDAQVGRRAFLASAAGVLATTGQRVPLREPRAPLAPSMPGRPVPPAPEPIPSVLAPTIPVHLQLPGPAGLTLPFSQMMLGGLNVERTTIGDFEGRVATSFLVGTASGSDGVEYGLEVDLRVYEGDYVAADESTHHGVFALL